MLVKRGGRCIPGFRENRSTLSSTGCRGCTSPPKMHALLSMTDKTWEERRSLSVSRRRVHVPFSVLIGLAALIGIAAVVSGNGVVSEVEGVDCYQEICQLCSKSLNGWCRHEGCKKREVRTSSAALVASGRSLARAGRAAKSSPANPLDEANSELDSATSRD
jgi:hypothetical protein